MLDTEGIMGDGMQVLTLGSQRLGQTRRADHSLDFMTQFRASGRPERSSVNFTTYS